MSTALKENSDFQATSLDLLGEFPSRWQVEPGLAVLRERQVKNIGLVEPTVLSLSYGRVVIKPQDKLRGLVPESFETYQIVEPGNIIIRPTDLQNDHVSLRVGQAKDRGIITSAYMCLETKGELTEDYAHLLLHAYDIKKVFYGLGSGLRQNLSWVDFRRLPIPVPPTDEQVQIVRFIRHLDQRVNRLIKTKRRLIELLNEQKQAIIHRAVTRGLDPTVPLKPSGIDWLGDVPEHWRVMRVRHVAEMLVSNVDKHSHENEEKVRLCNYVDVYKNEAITEQLKYMVATASKDEIERFRIKIGDVIITKDSELWSDIGVPAVVRYEADDLVCGYHLAILRPKADELSGEFLLRCLQDRLIATQLHVSANGITRYGLSQGPIKSCLSPVPPIDEQGALVSHLMEATRDLTLAISKAQSEIDLIREYRSCLVADVVTGQLDVRHLDLPEVEESLIEAIDAGSEDDAGDGEVEEDVIA